MTASVSPLHQERSWRPWTGSAWPTTRWSTSPRTTGAAWRRRTAAGSWAAGTGATEVMRAGGRGLRAARGGRGLRAALGRTRLALCLRVQALPSSLTLGSQHLCNVQSPTLRNLIASKRFNLWSLPLFVDPMDGSPPRLLCPWDCPGKNTAVGCHSLLQGIFPAQGSNPGLLHWQVDY